MEKIHEKNELYCVIYLISKFRDFFEKNWGFFLIFLALLQKTLQF